MENMIDGIPFELSMLCSWEGNDSYHELKRCPQSDREELCIKKIKQLDDHIQSFRERVKNGCWEAEIWISEREESKIIYEHYLKGIQLLSIERPRLDRD
jgi:hypothetical protein